MTDTEERIVQLEELVAHQAKVIEELSDQVARQWDAHERERKRLEALIRRFLELEETATPAPEITKPPHY